MKKWLDMGIEEIYFFMHMHDEVLSPELTQYVVKQINKKTAIRLPEVVAKALSLSPFTDSCPTVVWIVLMKPTI